MSFLPITAELMLLFGAELFHLIIIQPYDNLCQLDSLITADTSPFTIPNDNGIPPLFRTKPSIARSALTLEDCLLTIDDEYPNEVHFVRKLVSINTKGVDLFSKLPTCSPIRKGDDVEDNQRFKGTNCEIDCIAFPKVAWADLPRQRNIQRKMNGN